MKSHFLKFWASKFSLKWSAQIVFVLTLLNVSVFSSLVHSDETNSLQKDLLETLIEDVSSEEDRKQRMLNSIPKFNVEDIDTSIAFRLYNHRCLRCHAVDAKGHVGRFEATKIAHRSAEDFYKLLMFLRDAPSHNIQLKGFEIYKSEILISLTDYEIISLSSYLNDITRKAR